MRNQIVIYPCPGTFEEEACEVSLTYSVDVTLDRPPYPCHNHDDPRYSDPGDYADEEITDGPERCPQCGCVPDEAPIKEQAREQAIWASEEAYAARRYGEYP